MPRPSLVERIARKLHPRRFRVSPMFHAILAYLRGQAGWTTPEFVSLTVTSWA